MTVWLTTLSCGIFWMQGGPVIWLTAGGPFVTAGSTVVDCPQLVGVLRFLIPQPNPEAGMPPSQLT